MKNKELLKNHPKTTQVLIEWFTDKMFKSFTSETPEDMKHYMTKRGVTEEQLSTLIGVNPRTFFDVFDDNGIFICIILNNHNDFCYSIIGDIVDKEFNDWNVDSFGKFKSRISAEIEALEKAFIILEKRLTND